MEKKASDDSNKLLSQNDLGVLLSGNRNNAPSKTVLYKIYSESKKKFDLDPDFNLFLCKLRHKLLADVELKGKYVPGFIQGIYPPFSVTLFTYKQLIEVVTISQKHQLCLYFDATGRIFAQPSDSDTRFFLLLFNNTCRRMATSSC